MAIYPTLDAKNALSTSVDVELIAVAQDGAKKAAPPKGPYKQAVEKFRKGDVFTARLGSSQYLRFGGKRKAADALVFGVGNAAELTEEKLRTVGGNLYPKLKAERAKNVAVSLDSLFLAKGFGLSPARAVRALAEGLILGAYTFDKHKSKSEDGKSYQGPSRITFVTANKKLKAEIDQALSQASAVAESVQVTRDWSNEPSNIGTPEFYAEEAVKLGKQYGLKVRVMNEKECEKEKMHLFLGVGQGSDREGKVVIVEYTPKAKEFKTIALVGKGVTFDTGGISIKPSMKMEEMKHDMTGAATVMGAMILAAKWKIQNRVIGVMAFTENMPSGNAITPGNIIRARNGKTVEIINTDAEGRLILADALDLTQDMKPDAMLDIATLTGAVGIALGKHACAVMGNDVALVQAVRHAGDLNGERIWELPLYDEYFEDMKADHADMKNSCNDPMGGTIRGGIFLKQFVRKGTKWAHLDIAYTSSNTTHLSYFPKRGANGQYVRTLAQFAADFQG
jgi:leucyl aminopeptidase